MTAEAVTDKRPNSREVTVFLEFFISLRCEKLKVLKAQSNVEPSNYIFMTFCSTKNSINNEILPANRIMVINTSNVYLNKFIMKWS